LIISSALVWAGTETYYELFGCNPSDDAAYRHGMGMLIGFISASGTAVIYLIGERLVVYCNRPREEIELTHHPIPVENQTLYPTTEEENQRSLTADNFDELIIKIISTFKKSPLPELEKCPLLGLQVITKSSCKNQEDLNVLKKSQISMHLTVDEIMKALLGEGQRSLKYPDIKEFLNQNYGSCLSPAKVCQLEVLLEDELRIFTVLDMKEKQQFLPLGLRNRLNASYLFC